MATLTTSYQKVKETKLGSWGYGTLYLRTYAKYNSQDKINAKTTYSVQSRIYNNGTYCYSGNCYNVLQGETKKDNVRIDFENGEITLGTVTNTVTHNTDGSKSISLTNTFKCYALGSTTYKANVTVDLPIINRMDKATGLDFDIGSATLITITRYNPNFTRTVVASIGTFKETLIEKGTDTQISWQPEASDLYKQVTKANTGTITLTTTTYNGNTVIGTTTNTLKCRVTESNPIINSVAITDSLSIIEENILVRHMSKPTFTINAEALNEATITSYSVTELNSSGKTDTSNAITLNNTVTNNSFLVKVTDSRGNSTSANFSAENFIEYVLPAIAKLDLVRTGENLDQIKALISGVWFNQAINDVENTIVLKYRYKTNDGEYSDYIDIVEVPTENQFIVETIFNPDDGFDTNSVFTIEVVAIDNLTRGNLTSPIGKAIPLTDHWNENDKDYYNINAEIQQYGVPLFGDQKILWEGASYLNATQSAKLAEPISKQKHGIVLAWSGYVDGAATNTRWNYNFIPKEHVKYGNGNGVACIMASASFGQIGNKYIYVFDDKIDGYSSNNTSGTTNGITWANNTFVLRYVLGV